RQPKAAERLREGACEPVARLGDGHLPARSERSALEARPLEAQLAGRGAVEERGEAARALGLRGDGLDANIAPPERGGQLAREGEPAGGRERAAREAAGEAMPGEALAIDVEQDRDVLQEERRVRRARGDLKDSARTADAAGEARLRERAAEAAVHVEHRG